MTCKQKIGDYLKKCREYKGLTQTEVAKELGYESAQFISNVERGSAKPSLKTVKQWCEIVGSRKTIVKELMMQEQRRVLNKAFS